MYEPRLDPNLEYVTPGLLDEPDIEALKLRLATAIEMATDCFWMGSKEHAAPLDKPHDKLIPYTSNYRSNPRLNPAGHEDIKVHVMKTPSQDYPSLLIEFARETRRRGFTLREPIRLDRSNALRPRVEPGQIISILTRWLDMISRPIWWSNDTSDPMQVAFHHSDMLVRHTLNELVRAEDEPLFERAEPSLIFDFGKPYSEPRLLVASVLAPMRKGSILRPETAEVLASLVPSISHMGSWMDGENYVYELMPHSLPKFTLSRPLGVLDSMKLLRPFADIGPKRLLPAAPERREA